MLDRPALASRFSSLPSGVADFAAVGAFLQSRSFSLKAVGVDGGGWVEHGFLPEHRTPDAAGQFGGAFHPRHAVATNFSSLPGPHNIPITMTGIDAAEVLPDGDASDVVIILDPPYENTSGYANDSPRAAVLALARAWKEAGALVIIHEAVGLADALGAGWEERPAGVLRGKASNFWKGGEEREWITASDPPTWWPAQQMGLF